MSVVDMHQYKTASLNATQARDTRADNLFPLPAGSLPREQPGQEAPTSFDRALGLSVVLGLAIGGAVSILYLSYRVAEFLFGVRI